MLKVILCCIALSTTSLGCFFVPGNAIKGSGTSATETRVPGEFSRIRIDGMADVVVTIGQPVSMTITADDNLLPLIETKVEGDQLLIRESKSVSSHIGVKVAITAPSLTSVQINGSGDVKVDGLRETAFSAGVRGSGDVTVVGTADSVDASIAGSGDLRLGKLVAKDAKVSISGSGDATVNATESVTASVSGSGDIQYLGNPKQVQKSIAGSGSVRAK